MVMTVVTPETMGQLITEGKLPEYKPPAQQGAAQDDVAAKDTKTAPTRDPSTGQFTKPGDGDTTTGAGATPEKDDDEGSDDLPERARRAIGKKHREKMEAEEFGKDQYLKRTAAEQRAESAERELAELKKAKSGPEPAQKEPKPEDFKTVAEYTDALVKFRVAEERAKEKAEDERQRQEQAQAEREAEFAARVAKAKVKYPDFQESLDKLKGTKFDLVPLAVVEYIQESEFGPDLLYKLANDTETLNRLQKLSPTRFIAELGKLETKLETAAAPAASLSQAADNAAGSGKVPAISRAPAPVQILDGKQTTIEADPSKMSFKELREYERRREAEKRASR